MTSEGDEAKTGGGKAAAAASSLKLWIGLVVLLLGIPTAIYGAVQNWDRLFPPDPTIEFAACNQKNIQLTIFNRRQSRATIQDVMFSLESGGNTGPLKMNATLDDPFRGARGIGPKGDKELPYPNDVDEYFTQAESAAGCKVHVLAHLQYEHRKEPTEAKQSCDCKYEP